MFHLFSLISIFSIPPPPALPFTAALSYPLLQHHFRFLEIAAASFQDSTGLVRLHQHIQLISLSDNRILIMLAPVQLFCRHLLIVPCGSIIISTDPKIQRNNAAFISMRYRFSLFCSIVVLSCKMLIPFLRVKLEAAHGRSLGLIPLSVGLTAFYGSLNSHKISLRSSLINLFRKTELMSRRFWIISFHMKRNPWRS